MWTLIIHSFLIFLFWLFLAFLTAPTIFISEQRWSSVTAVIALLLSQCKVTSIKKAIKRGLKAPKSLARGPQGCQIYQNTNVFVFLFFLWMIPRFYHCFSDDIITSSWYSIATHHISWFSSEYKNHNVFGFTSLEMWMESRCENNRYFKNDYKKGLFLM